MDTLQVQASNGWIYCPVDGCDFKCDDSKLSTLRVHAKRKHEVKITLREVMTPDEKIEHRRKQLRMAAATFRQRHRKHTRERRSTRIFQPILSDQEDALAHGKYKCNSPFVEYKKSRIENAGNGLFASCDFKKGDFITYMSGNLVSERPIDSSYTLQVGNAFLDGLRIPKKGKGMGSFINREDRKVRNARKNCEFYIEEIGRKFTVYIRVIKDVKAGDELYLTYGRGFRITK